MSFPAFFAEEESYSDSESGDDVYRYLGPSTLPQVEFEEEACDLMWKSDNLSSRN